jgi:hypothetical protein
MPRTIDLEPVYTEKVSPRGFVRLYKSEPDDIESVRIIAPRIGARRDFGHIEVTHKTPTYVFKAASKGGKKSWHLASSSGRKYKK